MLVSSMTLGEVRQEIEKDFPILFRKTEYIIEEMEKALKRNKKAPLIKTGDYLSKYKNKWIYTIELKKENAIKSYMVYFHNGNGINAVQVLDNNVPLLYYTAHFFKRYNERLKLNLTIPEEVMKLYLSKNELFKPEITPTDKDGISDLFCVTLQGVILGTFYHKERISKMNTFITHDMLNGDQIQKGLQMRNILDKYRRHFDFN